MAARLAAVVCGMPVNGDAGRACDEAMWLTDRPAASLWCPVHGHTVDVLPSAPLDGVVFLTTAEYCEVTNLGDL